MIQVILGSKGSGKTIKLIDEANNAVQTERGNIIYIDHNNRHIHDLKREVRLVNAAEYAIDTPDAFYGLLCGMLSANFDITLIVIDGFMSTVNATNATIGELEPFFARLEAMSEQHNVRIVIGISGEAEEMPEFVTRYAI